MTNKYQEALDITNVSQWHEKGWTGKGIKIAIIDEGGHARGVEEVAKIVGIDTETKLFPFRGNGRIAKSLYEAKEWGANIVNMSISPSNREEDIEAEEYLYKEGIVIVRAAGNDGYEGLNESAKRYTSIAVGECTIRDGKAYRSRNSAVGEKLDCVAPSPGKVGTSFSAPFVAGMLALKFQSISFKLDDYSCNTALARTFIHMNCVDLEREGHDNRTGYGLFRLPNIEQIHKSKHTQAFTDIEHGRWSEEVIRQANELGIVEGYPDNTFRPTEQPTREEVVAFGIRLLKAAIEQPERAREVLQDE